MLQARSALVVLASFFMAASALGCSSSVAEGPTGSGSSGTSGAGAGGSSASGTSTSGAGGAFDAGGAVTTYTASIGPITAASGVENTQCIVMHLSNAEGAFVRRFHTKLQTGTHHMIAYITTETTENLTPTNCLPFAGLLSGDHPMFIAQQPESELDFPTDENDVPVGLELAANQMVRLELHYINTTSATLQVGGTIDIDTIPLGSTVTKSDLAFWGTNKIDIPPNASWDTGVHFQQALSGTKTFALTTHQHHLGTEMRVWYASSATDPMEQLVADNKLWSNPTLVLFPTPLSFPDSGSTLSTQGFAYDCTWNNPTPNPVSFGESFNDEMCFLWHYYYPAQGFQLCIDDHCM